jgi:hypothetical protein
MEKISLFDNDVYKIKYNFDWNVIGEICTKTMYNSRNNIPLIEETRPHKLEVFDDFFNFLKPYYQNIIVDKWGLSNNNTYYIEDSWIRNTTYGEFISEHSHGKVVAIICAYIKMPMGSEMLELRNPSYKYLDYVPNENQDWAWKKIDTVENDILIIPGWYHHRTKPSNSNDFRYMLAINVGVKMDKKLI